MAAAGPEKNRERGERKSALEERKDRWLVGRRCRETVVGQVVCSVVGGGGRWLWRWLIGDPFFTGETQLLWVFLPVSNKHHPSSSYHLLSISCPTETGPAMGVSLISKARHGYLLIMWVLIWSIFWAAMMKKKNVNLDNDGAARTTEGRFFNLQPHFCSLLIIG
ncbi:hypothetical protein HanIR_Chr12g0592911 [Helianthus annuus]|nr:hypothetical protein HanIR_Chr12g0592911 [Helianthus annuus]